MKFYKIQVRDNEIIRRDKTVDGLVVEGFGELAERVAHWALSGEMKILFPDSRNIHDKYGTAEWWIIETLIVMLEKISINGKIIRSRYDGTSDMTGQDFKVGTEIYWVKVGGSSYTVPVSEIELIP